MNDAGIIYTELAACQDCYKCLRECPVKAIRISGGRARVVSELCINCGHCVEVCPQKAKKARSDLERAKTLVRLKARTMLSLAPSFAVEFSDIPAENLIAGMKALGFWAVSETSLGADLVSAGLSLVIEKERPSIVISSACPSIRRYIDKYLPSMSPRIANVCSPMVAHGRYLRKTLGRDIGIVFAGPCVAKKKEAETQGSAIDVALTFEELRGWLDEEKIDLKSLKPKAEDRFFPKRSSKGALYPIEGGMIASMKHEGLLNSDCMTFSGIKQVREAIQDLEASPGLKMGTKASLFLELLACEGGCVNGPKSTHRFGTVTKRLGVLSYSQGQKAGHRGTRPIDEALIERSIAIPDDPPILEGSVSPEQERHSLATIGKFCHKDELNCSGCGYDSCRAFARAMVLGNAEKTMCVSYMRNLAQKKANALLKAMPSAAVIVDASMLVVECNRPFAELLGPDLAEIVEIKPSLESADIRKLVPFWQAFEDVLVPGQGDTLSADFHLDEKIVHGTIFSIEKGHLAGGLFQDITDPWIQKDRVIRQAKKVMRQNLKTVQKIAYLLGENAADAEVALTSIVESFKAQAPDSGIEAPKGGRR